MRYFSNIVLNGITLLLLCLTVSVLTLNQGQAWGQTVSSVLTVDSQLSSGQHYAGKFITLSQNGNIIDEGSTTVQFNLISGQNYTVAASDFGQYKFDHWLDNNSTVNPRDISITQDSTIVAVYYVIGGSGSSSNFILDVSSQLTSGQDLPGFFTILAQDNQVLNVGFTPIQFELVSGQNYTVAASDFDQYKFDHWLDNNSTVNPRDISITQDTPLVAVYSIIDTSGSGSGSGSSNFILDVSSQLTSGQDLPGFFTILAQDNQVLNVGFTPIQFELVSGQEYQVGVSDFDQYKFDHWLDNNSIENPRTISITQNTPLVAVYSITDTSGSGTGIPTIHKDDSSRIPPPSLSGNGQFQILDGFTVGGDSYSIQSNLIDIPTHKLIKNVPQTIVVKAYSDSALGTETTHVSLNIGPHPMSNIGQAVLSMTWDKTTGLQVTDPQGFVSNVSVNKQTVGSVDTFTFTFTPVKDMPTSDVLIRAWNSKMSSIDYLMTNAVKFTGEFLSPAPSQLPATLKVYDNISDLQKQLDSDGYVRPHILSHIHDTSSVFNSVPGKVYWFYDTADKTVALVLEDGNGKVLDMQIEVLVAQTPLPDNQNYLLGDQYYSHHSLSRYNIGELESAKTVEQMKALDLLMKLYGRDYVVQYHFLG